MEKWLVVLLVMFVGLSCGDDKKATSDSPAKLTLIDDLRAQVQKSPDSAAIRMQLINAFDSLKMYREAIEQTDSLITKDSLNNKYWLIKALLQGDYKDTSGAINSYVTSLNIYPSADVQLNLANLFAETKNQKALLICDNVRKMGLGKEVDANCNFIAGIYFSRKGENKKALQLFDAAINDNYTLMEAYMEKGFIYYESKNYHEALKIFDKAITVTNTYADAYYWKAKCNEAIGNKEEAILNYKRSLGLDKQLQEAADAIRRLE